MALKYLAGNKITGLAADTKPTTVPEGSFFTETDTKKEFILISGTWTASGVGASIEGSEITAGTISISKLSSGTPNKTLGFDGTGAPAELASASGVSPSDTVTLTKYNQTYKDYERPHYIKLGKNNDLTETPLERSVEFKAGGEDSYLTFSDDFDPASTEWSHNGSTAYSAQSGLHLHTDHQSASTLDLRKFVGTPSAPKPLNTDAWCLRFRFEWSDKAINTSYWGHMMFGLSSKDNTVFANQNQCFVGFTIKGRSDTSFYNYYGMNQGNQNPYSHSQDSAINYNEKDISYVEISRQGDRYEFRLYSDEHYENKIHNWSTQGAADYHNEQRADSYTGNDSNQELKYLKVMGYCTNTAEKNYIQGKVDNIQFWNGCSDAPTTKQPTDIVRENDLWTENYFDSGKPRHANPDTNTNIGDVAPNGTVFTRNNKWYDFWTDDIKFTETQQVDTGSSQDGHLATNSSYPSSARLDTMSSGNFGIGIYLQSSSHPVVRNSNSQYNTGEHRGEGSWGKPLKDISVWLWKKEASAGNLTGNLVMRVFNGGGTMTEHHRFTSHNYVDIATLSSVESVGSKITFDMTGYSPRSGDYILVEPETTNSTISPNPNCPPYYKSTGAYSGNSSTHLESGFNSSNCIHMVARYIEDNDLSCSGRHYSTTSITTQTDWIIKWEATIQPHLTTKTQDYPIIDSFVGYPHEGVDRRNSANDQQWKDTKDTNFYEDNWSWQGTGTWGTDTTPEHFYYKRRVDGSSTTMYAVNMREEYNRRTSYKYPRKNTTAANPTHKYWDYGTVAHRYVQVRVGGAATYEVWVSDTNTGQPRKYDTRNSSTNPWRKIAWGTEGTDYVYFHDRFRYMRFYVENQYINQNDTHDFYYAYDMKPEQRAVTHLMLNPHADMTETQFEIQICDDSVNENKQTEAEHTDTNNKWTTVRTITVSNMTNQVANYIRIPVSKTSRIRLKGKNTNKCLSFNQIKFLYETKDQLDNNHGHQALVATDATLNLDGSA